MGCNDSETANFVLEKHRLLAVFEFVAHPEGLLIPMVVYTPWAPFACGSNLGFEYPRYTWINKKHRTRRCLLLILAHPEGFEPSVF